MGKLRKAITLVELVISLTMVSVLMLSMFNVVAKKTKLALHTSSGNMVCWKDTAGNLWQRTIYRTKDGKTTEEAKIVSSCILKVPDIVKSGGRTFDVYLIGGGSAGRSYVTCNANSTIKTRCDETTEELLNSCVKYNTDADSQKFTIPFKPGDRLYEKSENIIKEIANKYKNDENMSLSSNIGCIDTTANSQCYLKLHDGKYYNIIAGTKGCDNNILYYASTKNPSGDIMVEDVDGINVHYKDVPFILRKNLPDESDKICYSADSKTCYGYLQDGAQKKDNDILNGAKKVVDLANSKCIVSNKKLTYKPAKEPKALASWVSAKSVQINLEKDLTIPKANIGSGGTSRTNCDGGDTVFPEMPSLRSSGQKCETLDIQSETRTATPGKNVKITNAEEAVGPKVPELKFEALNGTGLLGGHKSYNGRYNNSRAFLDDNDSLQYERAGFVYTGSQMDNGFGLFGMQGGSAVCSMSTTFANISYYGTQIATGTKNQCTNIQSPGAGMGGAIVIVWQ